MAELRAHRTRESFRRKYGRSLGASRKPLHPYGRSSSRRTRRGGKRQSLHRLSRSTQEEWAAGVSQWVARREVERVNRRFRNALGLDRDYSTDEWRELHQEWQDRALLAKASKWLRHSKTGKTHSFAKRRMVASVGESVERSATLRDLRISERQAGRKKPAPKGNGRHLRTIWQRKHPLRKHILWMLPRKFSRRSRSMQGRGAPRGIRGSSGRENDLRRTHRKQLRWRIGQAIRWGTKETKDSGILFPHSHTFIFRSDILALSLQSSQPTHGLGHSSWFGFDGNRFGRN